MSIFNSPENLRLLQNLLNPDAQKDDSDADDDEGCVVRNCLNPGSIGAVMQQTAKKPVAAAAVIEPVLEHLPRSVEEWHEMQTKEDAEVLETRQCPEYKMTYKQAVGTEDIFLQLGNRSNASASCEDLILEILLPDETTPADKMDLSITETEVDLATPIYRLKLPLVHKVNVDRCRAKYDGQLRKLSLTLRLQRELDFVNF